MSPEMGRLTLILLLPGLAAWGQQLVISTLAGGAPPSTPASAVSFTLLGAGRPAVDAAGNIYFSAGFPATNRSVNGTSFLDVSGTPILAKVDRNGALTRMAGN